jgi:hypothetical protein
MSIPARPFAGRLLAEIAKHAGGLPAVAAEMGITPQVIDALASGDTISAAELDAVYEWLTTRVRLTPEEAEDYGRLSAAASHPAPSQIQRPPTNGQPRPEPTPEGSRSSSARKVGAGAVAVATVVVVLIVVLTVVITITIIRPGSEGSPEAKASTSPRGLQRRRFRTRRRRRPRHLHQCQARLAVHLRRHLPRRRLRLVPGN